jgi:hypothetical protein
MHPTHIVAGLIPELPATVAGSLATATKVRGYALVPTNPEWATVLHDGIPLCQVSNTSMRAPLWLSCREGQIHPRLRAAVPGYLDQVWFPMAVHDWEVEHIMPLADGRLCVTVQRPVTSLGDALLAIMAMADFPRELEASLVSLIAASEVMAAADRAYEGQRAG